jgi:hypothetical protein
MSGAEQTPAPRARAPARAPPPRPRPCQHTHWHALACAVIIPNAAPRKLAARPPLGHTHSPHRTRSPRLCSPPAVESRRSEPVQLGRRGRAVGWHGTGRGGGGAWWCGGPPVRPGWLLSEPRVCPAGGCRSARAAARACAPCPYPPCGSPRRLSGRALVSAAARAGAGSESWLRS